MVVISLQSWQSTIMQSPNCSLRVVKAIIMANLQHSTFIPQKAKTQPVTPEALSKSHAINSTRFFKKVKPIGIVKDFEPNNGYKHTRQPPSRYRCWASNNPCESANLVSGKRKSNSAAPDKRSTSGSVDYVVQPPDHTMHIPVEPNAMGFLP